MANVTMTDVAKQLGVSRAAVSYALNGRARDRGVSKQLERRILRAAEEMGYRPSRLAQSLVNQRTHTLGLILPNMGASYGPILTESLETAARAAGYQVMLAHHGNDLDRFRTVLSNMLGWHIDGLAVVPLAGPGPREAIEELKRQPVPMTLIERDVVGNPSHIAACDSISGTHQAMQHLITLGHRRIALLAAPRELLESQAREDVYRQQLRQAEIDYDPSLHIEPPLIDTPEQYAARITQMLELPNRPTAAVAISGDRAISLYNLCRKQGLSIPDDMSIVAVTGMVFDEFSRIEFTSARLTYNEVGKAAFQLLQHDIENGPTSARRLLTAPQWIEGQSTCPPRVPQ